MTTTPATSRDHVLRALEGRCIAVARAPRITAVRALAECMVAAGQTILEVTLTCENALAAITECAAIGGFTVGAGTVLDTGSARRCLDAGAAFIVSPTTDAAVISTASEAGAVVIAGALTPTEIRAALNFGADAVKVFPIRMFGAQYLRDLAGPFPRARLVPSGGVAVDDISAYLRAGAFAVSLGSDVLHAGDLAAGDTAAIAQKLQRLPSSPTG